MTTFVLVHGAYGGGWVWRRVADILSATGDKVYTPTLTGLADRSHLLNGSINLDTHIADVANLIAWEGLDQVVLVGHSYAGWIISGVAERCEKAIASLVFVDAFYPENGQRGIDVGTPESRAAVLARTQQRRDIETGSIAGCDSTDNDRCRSCLGQAEDDASAHRGLAPTNSVEWRAGTDKDKGLHPGYRQPERPLRFACRSSAV